MKNYYLLGSLWLALTYCMPVCAQTRKEAGQPTPAAPALDPKPATALADTGKTDKKPCPPLVAPKDSCDCDLRLPCGVERKPKTAAELKQKRQEQRKKISEAKSAEDKKNVRAAARIEMAQESQELAEKRLGGYGNPEIVNLDFRSKRFTHVPASLERGDYYRLLIRCINPALYKISIGAVDTSSTKAMPPPTYAGTGLADLTTLASSVSALGGILGSGVTADKAFKSAKIREDTVDFDTAFYPELFDKKVVRPKRDDSSEEAKRLLDAYLTELEAYQSQLGSIKDSVQAILLAADYYTLRARLEKGSSKPASVKTLEKLDTRLRNVRARVFALEAKSRQAADNYTTLSAPYKALINETPGLKAKNEKALAASQELAKGIEAAKGSVSAENTRTLLDGLVNVINSSPHYYLSLPIQLTKDQTQLKINITPRDEKLAVQSYSTKLLFPLQLKNFWGVSTGFYGSWLRNDAYSTRILLNPRGDTAAYEIVKERPGRAEFGVSAMLRYGRQLSSGSFPVAIHGGFGPALSIADKVRPRLMVGGGVAFGRRHKLLLDGGLIGGYVDRKSQVFDTNPVPTKPDKITVSRLDVQGYIGLHYLFQQY